MNETATRRGTKIVTAILIGMTLLAMLVHPLAGAAVAAAGAGLAHRMVGPMARNILLALVVVGLALFVVGLPTATDVSTGSF